MGLSESNKRAGGVGVSETGQFPRTDSKLTPSVPDAGKTKAQKADSKKPESKISPSVLETGSFPKPGSGLAAGVTDRDSFVTRTDSPAVTATGVFPRTESKRFIEGPSPIRKDPRAATGPQRAVVVPASPSSAPRVLLIGAITLLFGTVLFLLVTHFMAERPPEVTDTDRIDQRLENIEATLKIIQTNLQQMNARVLKLESTSSCESQRLEAIQGYISNRPAR